jgi:hypothetical protein
MRLREAHVRSPVSGSSTEAHDKKRKLLRIHDLLAMSGVSQSLATNKWLYGSVSHWQRTNGYMDNEQMVIWVTSTNGLLREKIKSRVKLDLKTSITFTLTLHTRKLLAC